MLMSAELKASRRDATLILTLSNPGARNALHPDMYAAAIETLTTAERDEDVRAVVLTGADGFFCVGSHLQHADAMRSLQGWIDAIRDCPKPVIAAVEGGAEDAGFSLVLACDLVVAGNSVSFAMRHASTRQTPDGGGLWFLTHALPRQLVNEILLGGKPVAAARLYETGLINRLVNDGTALDSALAWAEDIALGSAGAIENIKSLARDAQGYSLSQHFAAEERYLVERA